MTFIKTLNTQTQGSLGQNEFDLILLPTGWLDCTIIHEAQILLAAVNKSIKGFQRPTLGPVRQFDIVSSDFVQLLHVNNNHRVCVSPINCILGYVNLMDSLTRFCDTTTRGAGAFCQAELCHPLLLETVQQKYKRKIGFSKWRRKM